MKISHLRTNHITNPLGFEFERLSLSWVTEKANSRSVSQTAAQVQIATDQDFEIIIFDSGKKPEIDSLGYSPTVELKARTRYFWRVTVWGEMGDIGQSDVAWFETAKLHEPWEGKWITPDFDKEIHPLIRKNFHLPANIVSARVYMCGVGNYSFEINGQKGSDEKFAPGFNAYDFWLQYQTYDITDLVDGGDNSIGIMLGNGLYKGRFGFDGGYTELYGSEFAVIAEIIVTFEDGSSLVIGTNEEWKCAPSPVKFSGIYDGEIYDANVLREDWSLPTFDDTNWTNVYLTKIETEKFQARLSLPVKIMEEIKPISIIKTPAGETVLDMGQVMTGWLRFKAKAQKGTELHLEYGEILQQGCFYRENLRTAKAEYVYISDGVECDVQPYFTFYGFRYVKVTGFTEPLTINDFTGCVLYSDLEETGSIETSNPLVNKLFQNTKWGQKGNFLDVPTDCPQRDERMGWTGDAQVFASTACYHMYSPAFYHKYMFDLHEEQKRLNGSVPFIVPKIKPKVGKGFVPGQGSAAWGDAATIIPWIVYLHYGDKELLRQHLPAMKAWVDYIKKEDDDSGAKKLWQVGFHFGDWLALDGKDPNSPMGGTDSYYIASAYYCYSSQIVAKAANALGDKELAEKYQTLADEIKEAIQKEFFTATGRSAIRTQTAMILALEMNLVPEAFRPRIMNDLKALLREDKMHLMTGFVGTPYFCHVLSENNANEYAYKLLLNDDFPSWLYAVKLGATTVWERWNSVLEDGSISGTGMNSLNHYAYGSIAEWMYKQMCGINQVEDAPGYRKIKLSPKPYGKLNYAKAKLFSASGLIESGWVINGDGTLTFSFTVPFNTTAAVVLPDANLNEVTVNDEKMTTTNLNGSQAGKSVSCELYAGTYVITYMPTETYLFTYSSKRTIREIVSNDAAKEIFLATIPELAENPIVQSQYQDVPIREIMGNSFLSKFINQEKLDELDQKLEQITYEDLVSSV